MEAMLKVLKVHNEGSCCPLHREYKQAIKKLNFLLQEIEQATKSEQDATEYKVQFVSGYFHLKQVVQALKNMISERKKELEKSKENTKNKQEIEEIKKEIEALRGVEYDANMEIVKFRTPYEKASIAISYGIGVTV